MERCIYLFIFWSGEQCPKGGILVFRSREKRWVVKKVRYDVISQCYRCFMFKIKRTRARRGVKIHVY